MEKVMVGPQLKLTFNLEKRSENFITYCENWSNFKVLKIYFIFLALPLQSRVLFLPEPTS